MFCPQVPYNFFSLLSAVNPFIMGKKNWQKIGADSVVFGFVPRCFEKSNSDNQKILLSCRRRLDLVDAELNSEINSE